MKKVGIFGSEYQADKQLVIKRLFEKLASLEAEVFVDRVIRPVYLQYHCSPHPPENRGGRY